MLTLFSRDVWCFRVIVFFIFVYIIYFMYILAWNLHVLTCWLLVASLLLFLEIDRQDLYKASSLFAVYLVLFVLMWKGCLTKGKIVLLKKGPTEVSVLKDLYRLKKKLFYFGWRMYAYLGACSFVWGKSVLFIGQAMTAPCVVRHKGSVR